MLATAFVAIFVYGSHSGTKYVVGVVAAIIGVSLWQQEAATATAALGELGSKLSKIATTKRHLTR